MVAHAQIHDVRWMAPQPMWGAGPDALNGAARRPSILRFATDAFMEELVALTATRPERLPEWLARPETWREPMPAPDLSGLAAQEPQSEARARLTRIARGRTPPVPAPVPPAPPRDRPLKLYQPAHGRFYLVAASLVCRLPGLPDRALDRGKQERAAFVLRRFEGDPLAPDAADAEEHAYVQQGDRFVWRRLSGPVERSRLHPGEERLPLFPLAWRAGAGTEPGRRRRMLAGALPAAKREAYLGAPAAEGEASPEDEGPDPRVLLFQASVVGPWTALIAAMASAARGIWADTSGDAAEARAALLLSARERAQTASWYLLLDLADFLAAHLPRVWDALNGRPVIPALSTAEDALFDALDGAEMSTALADALTAAFPAFTVERSLRDAMLAIANDATVRDGLETVETELDLSGSAVDDWPDVLFMAAHPRTTSISNPDDRSDDELTDAVEPTTAATAQAAVEALADLVAAALPATPAAPAPELSARPPAAPADREPFFVIRCVYERPNCEGFARPVVSPPSAPFQLASFFDPDAPARDVRIPMPRDISPAALRKYKKGAGFVVSDLFCGQMGRFRKFTLGDLVLSVLPWPFHKGLPGARATPCRDGSAGFGLLVSISIPIVTICAFILMIIMVALFDLIFRWLPWLITVIPIPGLRGKRP